MPCAMTDIFTVYPTAFTLSGPFVGALTVSFVANLYYRFWRAGKFLHACSGRIWSIVLPVSTSLHCIKHAYLPVVRLMSALSLKGAYP